MIGRSWVEIDLRAIADNYLAYREHAAKNYDVMAVVKADAYGHGDIKVASVLRSLGVSSFAVSNINEAVSLRKGGINGRILILGYTPVSCADILLKYDLTQTLLSEEYAALFADKGIKAQFAVDTGMNRIGLDADDPVFCSSVIHKYAASFRLDGIFTHLCVADDPSASAFTTGQIAKFKAVADLVADLALPCVHCMNSAGGLYCEPYGNLVRLGVVLYGLKPDYANVLPFEVKPALIWKSVVSMLKKVRAGESIGYGCSFTADRDMVVATIPTGYADGYSRALSNKGHVIIRGVNAPIVGRVCMDQMMVDVTEIPDVAFADEVVLIGDGYSADDMAHLVGTIGYEIVCGISKRVPKVYR